MDLLVGVDLGTSSVKVVATGITGRVVARAARPYPIHTPAPGYAEQDPDHWWRAACAALREVLGAGTAAAVGLSGQMHGLVAVDGAGVPVRPAIIWPDTRSEAGCAVLADRVGAQRVFTLTGAPVTTGFLAPSLLWLRQAEPDRFQQVRSVLLPKDYLRLRLTDELATDPSDAAGTLLLDLRSRRWSDEILTAVGLDPDLLPPIRGSAAVAGAVTPAASAQTGLPAGTPVVTGAGDLMAGALALGVTTPGTGAAIIGTGGQLVTSLAEPVVDPHGRVQTFPHAVADRWLLLGALLAAGQCLDWVARIAGTADRPALVAEAAQVPPGADGLLFLPYLNGVRTPHVDPAARGSFTGLTLAHGRGHLVRAVLEGVGYAMRECLDAMAELGVRPDPLVCAGGGAEVPLWRQIQADIYGRTLRVSGGADHSALGAARLAGAGLGLPDPGPVAQAGLVNPQRQERYEQAYARFRTLYPALKSIEE